MKKTLYIILIIIILGGLGYFAANDDTFMSYFNGGGEELVELGENNKPVYICTADYDPVCGVDGITYSNPCNAEKGADVKIAYKGLCESAKSTIITQEITMYSSSFEFDADELNLAVGIPVEITVISDGDHTFVVDELDIDEKTPEGSTVIKFTPETAGEFEFYCSKAGHRSKGQSGTLIISE